MKSKAIILAGALLLAAALTLPSAVWAGPDTPWPWIAKTVLAK